MNNDNNDTALEARIQQWQGSL